MLPKTPNASARVPGGTKTSAATWLGVLLLSLVVSVGCDRDEAGDAGTAGGGGEASKLKELRLGYFANLTHAQAVLGVSSGRFQQAVEPAKLTTKVFNAGPSLVEAIFAGEVDIGYIGPGPALAAHAQSRGEGVRVISGGAANGVLIVARKDSGVKALTDLAKHKLATPQRGNTQDISAKHYLTTELKAAKVDNVLPIANAEQATVMANGEIDASWAPEPWGSYLISQTGATLIAEEKDLWPQKRFATVVVITTPQFLREHPEVVRKFLGVHSDLTRQLTDEPDKQLPQLEAALFALTKKKLPAGVVKSALGYTEFTTDPLEHSFEAFGKWSYDLGFAKQPADIKGLIDTTLLDAAAASATGPATAAAEPAPAGADPK